MLGEALVPPHIIEAGLNHVAIHSTLAAIYNKARYRSLVKVELQKLADDLDILAANGLVAVLPFAEQGASQAI